MCDLIAHETVSLLLVLDEDGGPSAQWMRDSLALYAAAHQLEEADIQMDELCGCLATEAEMEDGKQLLTWEELRSELEAVAGALRASDRDAVPR